jgi:3D (Asp-Asp-Asp) domain-containing protein
LASPVTLHANVTYNLVSQENFGGDQWFDMGSMSPSGIATVEGGVFSSGMAGPWTWTVYPTKCSTTTAAVCDQGFAAVNFLSTIGVPLVSPVQPMNNGTFVSSLYYALLGQPDANGWMLYKNLLDDRADPIPNANPPVPAFRKDDAVTAVLASSAYRNHCVGASNAAGSVIDATIFVTCLYMDALGGLPTDGGVHYWAANVAPYGAAAVLYQFITSAPFAQLHGADIAYHTGNVLVTEDQNPPAGTTTLLHYTDIYGPSDISGDTVQFDGGCNVTWSPATNIQYGAVAGQTDCTVNPSNSGLRLTAAGYDLTLSVSFNGAGGAVTASGKNAGQVAMQPHAVWLWGSSRPSWGTGHTSGCTTYSPASFWIYNDGHTKEFCSASCPGGCSINAPSCSYTGLGGVGLGISNYGNSFDMSATAGYDVPSGTRMVTCMVPNDLFGITFPLTGTLGVYDTTPVITSLNPSSAPTGSSTLTITGYGFGDNPTVQVGGGATASVNGTVVHNSGVSPPIDTLTVQLNVPSSDAGLPLPLTVTSNGENQSPSFAFELPDTTQQRPAQSMPANLPILYSPTPTISSVQITPPLYAGGQAYAVIYGSNFGAQGSVAICASGDSSCSSTPDIAGQVTYWNCQAYCQVNVAMTATMNASGSYDIQINSGGAGSGFQGGPPVPAVSNRARFSVGPISLSLQRQSYRQFLAVGSPDNGQFTEVMSPQQGQLTATITSATATTNSATLVVAAPAPPPASNGKPTPGGLASMNVTYSMGGASASASAPVAAWGLSCYRRALESDFFVPQTGGCSDYTIQGVRYTGQTQNPSNLKGLYCNSFLGDTKLQGSGQDLAGNLIQYDLNTGQYNYVSSILATDGTQAVAGATAARDPSVVPDKNVTLGLDGIGTYWLNDAGGKIKGYRIDLFGGFGTKACQTCGPAGCQDYANPIVIGACSPASGGCPAYTTK